MTAKWGVHGGVCPISGRANMWPAGDQRVHRGVRRLYETPRPIVVGVFVVVLDCHQGGQNEAGSEPEPTSSCQEHDTTQET